jgi:hypothetical protein
MQKLSMVPIKIAKHSNELPNMKCQNSHIDKKHIKNKQQEIWDLPFDKCSIKQMVNSIVQMT